MSVLACLSVLFLLVIIPAQLLKEARVVHFRDYGLRREPASAAPRPEGGIVKQIPNNVRHMIF